MLISGLLFNNLSPESPLPFPKLGFTPSNALPAEYWISSSLFLSFHAINPIFSQFLNQLGASLYWTSWTESIKFILANADTAGAVEYNIAIKIKAYPADFLASLTFGTVKNLTITCGSPAVPNIKAAVIQKISIFVLVFSV